MPGRDAARVGDAQHRVTGRADHVRGRRREVVASDAGRERAEAGRRADRQRQRGRHRAADSRPVALVSCIATARSPATTTSSALPTALPSATLKSHVACGTNTCGDAAGAALAEVANAVAAVTGDLGADDRLPAAVGDRERDLVERVVDCGAADDVERGLEPLLADVVHAVGRPVVLGLGRVVGRERAAGARPRKGGLAVVEPDEQRGGDADVPVRLVVALAEEAVLHSAEAGARRGGCRPRRRRGWSSRRGPAPRTRRAGTACATMSICQWPT